MSGLNDRLAARLPQILAKHGFDAILQQRAEETSNDFEISSNPWTELATVKAVWDNPRQGVKDTEDGAQASTSPRFMTIAYRDDLKDTAIATRTRVSVNGVASNILTISPIGDKVGLRLWVEAGTEA